MLVPQIERLETKRRRHWIHERQHSSILLSEPETATQTRIGNARLVTRRSLCLLVRRGLVKIVGVQMMCNQLNAKKLSANIRSLKLRADFPQQRSHAADSRLQRAADIFTIRDRQQSFQ